MKSKNFKNILTKTALVIALALGLVTFGLGSQSKLASAACSSTPDPAKGTDTLSINVTTAGTYNVWTRMLAPDSTNNTVYMQIDGAPCASNVGGAIPANTWTWVNWQNGVTSSTISATLTAGPHQVVLTGNAPNVGVDLLLFLDSTCVPTGDGSNCTVASAPTVSITSPSSGATVSNTVNLSANATDQVSVSSVQFKIDSTVVDTIASAPYSRTWDTTSVSNGTHTFTAIATNNSGLTATASETLTVANNICSASPSTPSPLTATANGLNSIKLSWNTSTPAAGCTLSQYTVYRQESTGPNALAVVTPPATTFTNNGLTPNTSYSYYVVASDTGGHNATSNTASATTSSVTTPPNPPTNVTDSAPTSNAVTLNWTAATDPLATVTTYRIYRDGNFLNSVSGASTTTYTDSNNVQPNTSYTYAVSAVDQYGNESIPPTAAVPSPITTPPIINTSGPNAPTNFKTTAITDNTIALGWTASTDNNTSDSVAGYHVYMTVGGVTKVTDTTSVSFTDTGLAADTPYQYYVKAFDHANRTSPPSPTLNVRTKPGKPPTSKGDIYPDGLINYQDLSILLAHWGQACHNVNCGDLNGDGFVNPLDLGIMTDNWTQPLTPIVKTTSVYSSVYTKPNNQCTYVGGDFNIGINEYSGSTNANAVEYWVTWDPNYVTATNDYYDNTAFGVSAHRAVTDHSIVITRGTANNNYTFDKYIGGLSFHAKKAGTTYIYMRWHGTGLANAANGKDLAPTPYGSKVTISSASSNQCATSNNSNGGVEIIPPGGASATSNNTGGTVIAPPAAPTVYTNALPPTPNAAVTTTAPVSSIYVTPVESTSPIQVANNSPLELDAAAVISPSQPATGTLESVQYYLNNTRLALKTGTDLSYALNTTNYRNGDYNLVAKEILSTGISQTITTRLSIKNAASAKQLYLQTKQYIWLLVAVVIVLLVGGYSQKMFSKRHPNWSQPIVDPDVRSRAEAQAKDKK